MKQQLKYIFENKIYKNVSDYFDSKIKNKIISLYAYYNEFKLSKSWKFFIPNNINHNLLCKIKYIKIKTYISFIILYLQIINAVINNKIYKYTKYKNIKIINKTKNNTHTNIYILFLILLSLYKIEKICYFLFNKKNKECLLLNKIKNIFDIKYNMIHFDILYQNKNTSVIIDNNPNILNNKLCETIEYMEKNKKLLEHNKLSLNSIMTCANIIDSSHNLIYNMKCIFDKYSTNKIFNNTINNIMLFNDIKIENGDMLEVKIFGNIIDDQQLKSYKINIDKIKNLNIIDLYEYTPT